MQTIETPLGSMAVKGNEDGISALYFLNSLEIMADYTEYPWIFDLTSQLQAYFRGELRQFDLPLALKGTAFQVSVWETLVSQIPYGTRAYYSVLAEKMGKPKAIRAVSTACGKNPVAILVPCHRIIPKTGGIGQYNASAWRKEFLLHLEATKSDYK